MKNKILKLVTLATAAVALVVVTVLVTVAFLTSSSAVSNTFTVGDVGIHMYESKVNEDGVAKADDPSIHGSMKDSDGNNYHLIPGKTYDKDPTIYVDADSDKSYLFVKVRNNISTIESQEDGEPTIAEQMIANGWSQFKETTTGTVYVYTKDKASDSDYATVVGGIKAIQEIPVFTQFTVADNADVSLYGGAKVTLTAFAIQSTTFENNATGVNAAWDAIVAAYPYENGTQINE